LDYGFKTIDAGEVSSIEEFLDPASHLLSPAKENHIAISLLKAFRHAPLTQYTP